MNFNNLYKKNKKLTHNILKTYFFNLKTFCNYQLLLASPPTIKHQHKKMLINVISHELSVYYFRDYFDNQNRVVKDE